METQIKNMGIYIHIPFCKSKCFYCDFVSYTDADKSESYIEELLKEIEEEKAKLQEEVVIKTVYIGGGTPSCTDSNNIVKIINKIKEIFNVDLNAEITIEVNPASAIKEKLITYKEAGVNRLSIGLQTTNDVLLKKIGRIHVYEQFLETYNNAKSVGFNNINVDLIFALPNQSIEDLKVDLQRITALNPNHISIYSLILEEGTKLYKLVQNNSKYILPDEELERQMYWEIKHILQEAGYNHYEISNFAKLGFESKHNLSCWSQEEYLGFGLAAHSYYNDIRYSNTENLGEYISNREKIIDEKQDIESKIKEYMVLKFRTIEGISISEFEQKFKINPIILFRNELSKLVSLELVEVDLDRIYLTSKGLDFANQVFAEFVL